MEFKANSVVDTYILHGTRDRLVMLGDIVLLHGVAHNRTIRIGQLILRALAEKVGGSRVLAVQNALDIGKLERCDKVCKDTHGRCGGAFSGAIHAQNELFELVRQTQLLQHRCHGLELRRHQDLDDTVAKVAVLT
jgi:hypothetical protein